MRRWERGFYRTLDANSAELQRLQLRDFRISLELRKPDLTTERRMDLHEQQQEARQEMVRLETLVKQPA